MKRRPGRPRHVLLALALVAAFLLVASGTGYAAYPGEDNGLIAFDSRRDDGIGDIFVMFPDGSGQANITSSPGRDTSAKWSPDGTRIAFMSQRTGGNEIYTINSDGSGLVQVTNTPGLFSEDNPTWSPDGSQIAFIADISEIWLVDSDGASPHQVASGLGTIQELTWSPDGSKFAFQGTSAPGGWNVFTINVDGTGVKQLTALPGHDYQPDWSLDGSHIIFASNRHGDPEIYRMDVDGQNQVRLTVDGFGDLPRWSPDGTQITFTSYRTGGPEIFVMAADGSGQTQLTFLNGFDFRSDWQPLKPTSPPADSGTFIDDNGHEFEAEIEAIAAAGTTQGCGPSIFCPDDNVTRGEMALFLVRAMGYTDNGGGNRFTDDDGSFYEDAADKLRTAGVTLGCNPPTNDHFCGDDFVNRSQMAAFLVRAKGYTDNGGGNLFTDDNGSIFENDIDKLATAGVTKGCGTSIFCPDDFVTRGQMAAFLTRALGLTP